MAQPLFLIPCVPCITLAVSVVEGRVRRQTGSWKPVFSPNPAFMSLPFLRYKSVTPEWVLQDLIIALQGNSKLTHLNLSSNKLGMTVPLILKALRHSACNLKYLW